MDTRSRAGRLTAVLVTALLALPLAGAVPAAADGYPAGERIRPGALARGADTPLLHLVDRTIVDGDTRVDVAGADHVTLLGRSGGDYLVVTSDSNFANWRLQRVTDLGEQTVVAAGRASQPSAHLADGGRHVVLEVQRRRGTVLRVVDSVTGRSVARRSFANVSVLDFAARRMVLAQWQQGATPGRTFWWNPFTDRTPRVARHSGYIADVSANRVGVFLGDPYQGGCQKVMTLRRPRTTLWRSCTDRALSLSPGGDRLVSSHILTDGPGPYVVQVRARRGRVLDTYRSEWFGTLHWENDRRLLLQVAGRKAAAMARCTVRACERIADVHPTRSRDPWEAMPIWQFAPESLLDR